MPCLPCLPGKPMMPCSPLLPLASSPPRLPREPLFPFLPEGRRAWDGAHTFSNGWHSDAGLSLLNCSMISLRTSSMLRDLLLVEIKLRRTLVFVVFLESSHKQFFLGLTQTIAISFFWEVFNVWKPEGSGNSFHFRHYELQTKYFTKYLTKYSESDKTGLYWTDNPEIEPFNRKHRKFCRRSQIKLKFPVRKFWKFRGCSLRNSPRFSTAANFAFITWDRD